MDNQIFQLIVVLISGGLIGLVIDRFLEDIPYNHVLIVVFGLVLAILGYLLELGAYRWWSYWLVPFGIAITIIGLIIIIWNHDASRYWLTVPILLAMAIIVFWMEPFSLQILLNGDDDNELSVVKQGSNQGVSIILEQSNGVTRNSETDENGIAQFSNIYAGNYFIEHPDGQRYPLSGNRFNSLIQLGIELPPQSPGEVAALELTPEKIATLEATITIAPTITPEATATVALTPTPEPTATVAPTETTEAAATVAPTATSEATATVAPTETSEATATIAPTATTEATATVVPTATATPEATEIPPYIASGLEYLIIADSISLRDGPGEIFNIIENIIKGETVRIIATIQDENPWYYVKTEDSQFGWILAGDNIGEIQNVAPAAIPTSQVSVNIGTTPEATLTAEITAVASGSQVNATQVPEQAPRILYFFASTDSPWDDARYYLNWKIENANRVEIFGQVMDNPVEGSWPIYNESNNWTLWAGNDQAWVEQSIAVEPDKDIGSRLQNITVDSTQITFLSRDPQFVDGDMINVLVNGQAVVNEHRLQGRHQSIPVTLNSGDNTIEIYAQSHGLTAPMVGEFTISNVISGPSVQYTSGLSENASQSFIITAP